MDRTGNFMYVDMCYGRYFVDIQITGNKNVFTATVFRAFITD
jgi:hypothetical protein